LPLLFAFCTAGILPAFLFFLQFFFTVVIPTEAVFWRTRDLLLAF